MLRIRLKTIFVVFTNKYYCLLNTDKVVIIGSMTIAERIKQKRIAQKLTQQELASLVGITQQALHKIENGSTQKPRDLVLLAKELNCTAEWLLFGTSNEIREPIQHYNDQRKDRAKYAIIKQAPIISYLQAAQWTGEKDLTDQHIEWEETHSDVSENAFWLRVMGDSMTSASGLSIPEGYLILVEPSRTPSNGDLVIAKLEVSKEVTFKKLSMDAGHTYLRSLNPDYRPIEIHDDIRIIGVVTKATIRF